MKPTETPTTPKYLQTFAEALENELKQIRDNGLLKTQLISHLLQRINKNLCIDTEKIIPEIAEVLEKHQESIDLWSMLSLRVEAGKEILDSELQLAIMKLKKIIEDLKTTSINLDKFNSATFLEQRRAGLRKRLFGVSDQKNSSSQ